MDHSAEGLGCYRYMCDELGVELECWFEYEGAQEGYPATLTLMHAYLPGSKVDISAVLDRGVMEEIEEWVVGVHEGVMRDQFDERAIARYEDWRDYE